MVDFTVILDRGVTDTSTVSPDGRGSDREVRGSE